VSQRFSHSCMKPMCATASAIPAWSQCEPPLQPFLHGANVSHRFSDSCMEPVPVQKHVAGCCNIPCLQTQILPYILQEHGYIHAHHMAYTVDFVAAVDTDCEIPVRKSAPCMVTLPTDGFSSASHQLRPHPYMFIHASPATMHVTICATCMPPE
jgi:hypothetical protein